MYLETERLLIRSFKSSDEKAFIEMASDGSLTEVFGDCSECHKWMGDFIKKAVQLESENDPGKEYLAYVIETKNGHTAVGSVGTSYYEDFQEIGVTYFIGARFRGKGYAAEALHALVEYFFRNYQIDRLIATVKTTNRASCKTLEKAGFQLTDTRLYQDLYDKKAKLYRFYSTYPPI